jgi:molybdate transport system substrate-binding protein
MVAMLAVVGGVTPGALTRQPSATDVVTVSCSNAVEALLGSVSDGFTRDTGYSLRFSCALAAAVAERIRARDAFDIVILPPQMIDGLAALGQVAVESRTRLGRSPIALAQRAGLPPRPARTAEELRAVLVASPSIAYAKQGLSGQFFTALLGRWTLLDAFAPRLRPMAAGAEVSAAVAVGDADLSVLPASEIIPVRGVMIATLFPPALDAWVVMELAAARDRADTPPVAAFVRFLTSPQAALALERHGFVR